MKKLFYLLIIATLLCACEKIEKEQDIVKFFENNHETEQKLITITGMDFANSNYDGSLITSWGKTLYSSQMRYLYLRITYNCNTNAQHEIKLFTKIFKPDGTLSSGTSSPEGYTMKKIFTSVGEKKQKVTQDLNGWGNNTQSIYSAGNYRIELWEENETPEIVFAATVQIK